MDNLKDLSNQHIGIVYQETSSELEMKTHFHNSHEIIYILEGTAQFKVQDKAYTCVGNSMVFISNLESHRLKVLEYPYKRFYIMIKPRYLQSVINEPILASILKHRPEHFNHLLSIENKDRLPLRELFEKIYRENRERKAFMLESMGSYIHLLFIFLYRNYYGHFPLSSLNSSMDKILEIQRYIEEHYMEDISLKEISKQFYTDMYYLSHLFKKVTGFTFKEYLILQRISRAKDRLFYTSDNITQVALDSGFNNVNHFIRIFKKFEGTTPYQYRKKYR